MPNVSCLSHVLKVDDDHVAISNRFFAWTAANIRANPKVAPIPVDGFMGDKFLLDVAFVRPVDSGALYDRIARRLSASSALVGMSDIMKLRSADIFLVPDIAKVPRPVCDRPIAAVPKWCRSDGFPFGLRRTSASRPNRSFVTFDHWPPSPIQRRTSAPNQFRPVALKVR